MIGKWFWMMWSVVFSVLTITTWIILGIGQDEALFLTVAKLTFLAMLVTVWLAGWTVADAVVRAVEPGGWIDAALQPGGWLDASSDQSAPYRSWLARTSVTERWRLCATGLAGLCVGMSLLILGMWATTLLLGPGMLLATLFAAAGVIALAVLGAGLVAAVVISGAAVWRYLWPQRDDDDDSSLDVVEDD
jgi:hypothetical protein